MITTQIDYETYIIDERSFVIRPDTTDRLVVNEIWKQHIYGFLKPQEGDLILDIGGHIGVAASWFAYHGAVVHTFEPIDDNFKMLEMNIPLGVTAYNMSVMYRRGIVPFSKQPGRDNHHASYSVIFGQQGEDVIVNYAVSWHDIFESHIIQYHEGPIKVKLDVEGAEYDHLLTGETPWLDLVDRMIIEFHIFTTDMKPFYDRAIDHLKKHFSHVEHDLDGVEGSKVLSYVRCWK